MMFRPPTYPRATLTADAVNIIWHGNSLVYGEGASNRATKSAPAILASILDVPVLNQGVGGQTLTQMISNAPTAVDANLHATKLNILLVTEITNTVSNNGRDGAAAVAQMQSYCAARYAAATSAGKKLRIIVEGSMPAAAGTTTAITDARMAAMIVADNLLRERWGNFCDVFMDTCSYEPFKTLIAGGVWTHAAFDAIGIYNRFTGGDGVANDRVHFGDSGYLLRGRIAAHAVRRIRIK